MKAVLFDLDGTLIDSFEGIAKSAQYALRRFGINEENLENLRPFVGPPLVESFQKWYGLSKEQAIEATDIYRERYRPIGILECSLYPGVEECIRTLKAEGYQIGMASSKPEEFCRRILEHFGLLDRFRMVSGPEFDGTRGEKHEVIDYAIETLGLTDRKRILMVGDRQDDILGARHCAVPAAGVLWGFGSKEELTAAGATVLFQTPAEAGDWLTQEGKMRG